MFFGGGGGGVSGNLKTSATSSILVPHGDKRGPVRRIECVRRRSLPPRTIGIAALHPWPSAGVVWPRLNGVRLADPTAFAVTRRRRGDADVSQPYRPPSTGSRVHRSVPLD